MIVGGVPNDERPSVQEVRRRIEVAFANAHIAQASDLASIAAEAVEPLIDALKTYKASATAAVEYRTMVAGLVRVAPPEVRASVLDRLRELEPWNGEWVPSGEPTSDGIPR